MKNNPVIFNIYFAIIIIFSSECVLTQRMETLELEQKKSFEVRGEVTLKVDLKWDENLVPSEQPAIVIQTSMSKNSKSNSFVNFVVLYGQNSEYWKQEMNGDSTVTLCIDHVIMSKFPTSLVIIAQNNHPASQVGINVLVTKKDLSLKLKRISKIPPSK